MELNINENPKAEPFANGIVTFSIDTELAWARINNQQFDDIIDILDQGVGGIEKLLATLNEYHLPATWAVVGQVCRTNVTKPPGTGGIQLFEGGDEIPWDRDWWHAQDAIQSIVNSRVNHEIGSHSGNHILFDTRDKQAVRTDLAVFDDWCSDVTSDQVESFVFPDNKVGHLDVLSEFGYSCYRGRTPTPKVDQAPRSYLPRQNGDIINIPTSISYRPYDGRNVIYRNVPKFVKNTAIKLGVGHAMWYGGVFHIVLHPQDFALDNGFLDGFTSCLEYISRHQDKNNLDVLTMGEVAKRARFKE